MSLRVINPVRTMGGPPASDNYLSRLIKMIPGEAITLYVAGSGFITQGSAPNATNTAGAILIWSVVCAIAIVVLRLKATQSAGSPQPQWFSILIALVSFAIWLYSEGGPFTAYHLKPVSGDFIGPLTILAWTFFVPIFYKGD